MKKSIKRVFALILTVLMVATVAPFSAIAADSLSFTEETGLTTDNYSFKVHQGVNYIITELQNVPKDRVITVKKGTSSVSFNMVVNDFYYGNNNQYCIAHDGQHWSFTSSDTDAATTMTGWGSSKPNDYAYGYSYAKDMVTSFSIDTSELAVDTYNFTIDYQYQMKKGSKVPVVGTLTSPSTVYEYVGSIEIQLVVEDDTPADTTTQADGASIKVGDQTGLRFRFNTTANDAQEFGFIYSYSDSSTLEVGSNGVYKVVANNKIYHEDEDNTTFNLVFVGIPDSALGTVVSVRSYVVDSEGVTHYSDISRYSYSSVAAIALADSDTPDATKDAINARLNVE